MSPEQNSPIPRCIECEATWLLSDEDRWRTYLDNRGVIAFYCPECAEREFGD